GCPDVVENIKWGSPSFEHQGLMCGMAAFKAHCIFGFWKWTLVAGKKAVKGEEAMGHFGRIGALSDLPGDDVLIRYVRTAADLNERGVANPRRARPAKPRPLTVPAYLMSALRRNKKALATFAALSPSHKREYLEWITEAKTEPTRERRLSTAVAWMAQGKSRNWKYERA